MVYKGHDSLDNTNYSVQFSIILYNLYEKWELVTFLLHAFTTITGIAVIITDIPRELLDESEVVKRYFDRWPLQEKIFREEKSSLNIQNIVGYGTKIESYDKMIERHRIICEAIKNLNLKLEVPLKEIDDIEAQLTDYYQQERILREKSKIEDGKRILDDADDVCFK